MSNNIEFSREILLTGIDGFEKIKNSKVIIFGIGGVGSYTAETLARAGVQNITLVDYDTVCITNINRQILASYDAVSKPKVDVMKSRIESFNKQAKITAIREFVTNENIESFNLKDYDFVVDAVDNVTAKLALMEYCHKNKIQIICSMGTGNKFNPFMFKVADISKTKVCPLARVIRYELKKRKIYKGIKVIFSEEIATKPQQIDMYNCKMNCVCSHSGDSELDEIDCKEKRQIPGSISYVPSVVGIMITSHVVNTILGK